MLAPPLAAFADDREALRLAFAISQNTQPGNLLNLCGTSTPIQGQTGVALPVGLQVLCPGGEDARLFSIALSLEDIFGSQPKPDVAALL